MSNFNYTIDGEPVSEEYYRWVKSRGEMQSYVADEVVEFLEGRDAAGESGPGKTIVTIEDEEPPKKVKYENPAEGAATINTDYV